MRQTTKFVMATMRLILQVIGTFFIGKFIYQKIIEIPAETWGWMALIVVLVVLISWVWLQTVIEVFKKN